MKKGIIVATALVGIVGGFALSQTALFSSAQEQNYLTAAEAKKLALQQFDGTVIEYDFDKDDRTPHYEFEIKNANEKVEIEVNALNGEAQIVERKTLKTQGTTTTTNTNQSTEATQSEVSQSTQSTAQALISKSEAIAIAQAKATGTVTKAKLDTDDGIQVYEIEIKNGQTEYDYEIHAITGKILKFDVDIDDNDDLYDDDNNND